MALNNVPQAGQTLAITRNPIQQNFSTIDTAFSVNHVAYGAAGQGKHNFVSLPVQGASPTTAAGEIALFSRTSAVTGNPELALRRQSNGTAYEISTYGTGTFAFNDPNYGAATYKYTWTRLPSGLIQLWGTSTSVSFNIPNAGITIPYPTGGSFPGFGSVVYYVSAGYQDDRTNPANDNNPLTVVYQVVPSLIQFTVGIATQWGTGHTFFYFNALGI